MSLSETFAKDLESIIKDKGCKFIIWNGEEYPVSASGTNNSKDLEDGGYSLETHNSFSIVKSNFHNDIYPVEQEKITYNGIKYRIVNVIYEGFDAFIRLVCQQEVK